MNTNQSFLRGVGNQLISNVVHEQSNITKSQTGYRLLSNDQGCTLGEN